MQATRTRSTGNSTPADKMAQEIEAIKDGLSELRGDVSALLGHAAGAGRQGARAAAAQVTQRFAGIKDAGTERVTEVERQIQAAPFKSVLIAFGAGYLFAKIF